MTSANAIGWSAFRAAGRELEYLTDAFQSGWISGGAYIERLETLLSRVFDGSDAYAVANGTAALQLAFQVLSVKPGDRVIVPSFCFQAAGNVLCQLGAVPIFCDVDSLTWNQTVSTVERAARDGAVGVVVVHNYGLPAPIDEICAWAAKKGLWVIEDGAEAWFSKLGGRLLGTFAPISTFSMHATKTIASGEGGVVLLNDPSLAPKLKLLRSHGLDRGKRHYFHELAGNNYRLSNLLAAVALAQLEEREAIIERQDRNGQYYLSRLAWHDCITLQRPLARAESLVWTVVVRIDFSRLTIDRDQLIELLAASGIETRPGFYPASSHEYYPAETRIFADVAEQIAANIVALPCPTNISASDIDRICETLISLIEAHRKPGAAYIMRDRSAHNFKDRVRKFADSLVRGSETFRYFNTRDVSVVDGHLETLLLESGGRDVAYGHLDVEGGVTWLGIAVADQAIGKGWGAAMMRALIERAAQHGVHSLRLRVDRGNEAARQLYRRCGFIELEGDTDAPAVTMSRAIEPICAL